MKKSLEEYIKKVDKLIDGKKISDIDKKIAEHIIKISFYQHERLIHFLVTMLFAILALGTVLYTITVPSIPLIIMCIIFLCLLIPYIFHYYFLENGVQKLYFQYDQLNGMKKRT